jgi:hypothetical protein
MQIFAQTALLPVHAATAWMMFSTCLPTSLFYFDEAHPLLLELF